MVLVGNEDEETTCEDEDRANANGMSYFEINRHPYTYINNYDVRLTVINIRILFFSGALNYEDQEKRTRAIVSSETASILGALGLKGQPLDVRIRKLADERDDLGDTVRRLKVITNTILFHSRLLGIFLATPKLPFICLCIR